MENNCMCDNCKDKLAMKTLHKLGVEEQIAIKNFIAKPIKDRAVSTSLILFGLGVLFGLALMLIGL